MLHWYRVFSVCWFFVSEADLVGGFGLAGVKVVNDELAVMLHGTLDLAKK